MNIERQYIGARYVPKFMGTYSATTQYDALSVVDDGHGTSYITKIPTPPNTPLTDTTYWALYGASSGAVLDLQTRMGVAENDITTIKSSILRIGGEVDDNTADINSLKNRVSNNEDDIDVLKNAVKNCIIIGDSWGVDNGTQTGWITHLSNMLQADHIYRNSYGGSGFVASGTGVTNKKFIDLIQEIESSITDKDSIDTVIVCGGVNDSGQTGVVNAGKAFIDYVATKYPNARVFIGIINRFLTGWITKYSYVNDYSQLSGYKNTRVEDMHMVAPFVKYADAGHLTTEGYTLVARAIYSALFGCRNNLSGIWSKTFSYHCDELNLDVDVTFQQVNDNISFRIPYKYKATSFSKTGGIHSLTFAKTSADVNLPINTTLYYPACIRVQTGTASYSIPATVLFTATDFTINWIAPIDNMTYTSILWLDVSGQTCVW